MQSLKVPSLSHMTQNLAVRLFKVAPFGVVFPLVALFCWASFSLAGEEVMENGITHIKNGATPAQGVETMELEELWRRGGEDDEEVLFGLIAQALLDDDNNIYLLDTQLSHVEVFSSTGEHLKTIGREGSGPGEFTMAFDMIFMPDGTLGVVQVFPGKIIKLDLDGNPAGEFRPLLNEAVEGGFLVLVNSLAAGGNLVLSGIDMTFNQETLTQTRTHFVKSFDIDGKPIADYHEEERIWDFKDFTLDEPITDYVWGRLAVGPDGQVIAAIPRNGYVLTVFNPDGSINRIIEREYKSWQRNERARARAIAQLEGQLRQFPPGTEYKIMDIEPDIAALYIRDDGSIWVLTSRAMWDSKPGVLQSFDVFSPEGHFLKQVDILADGSSAADLVVFARDDMVFQITGFYDALVAALGGFGTDAEEEAEPMEVICYRIR